MCGIAGLYSKKGLLLTQSKEKKIIDALRHRGPDDTGLINNRDHNGKLTWALFHTRLSINDISELGRNPMSDKDNKVHLVFNGEIYNFLTLKKDLISMGVTFHSNSDAEVLLQLYLVYGKEFVYRVQGMFAIAIFDSTHRVITLFRDRLGIKPLYFITTADSFFFASEIRALHVLGDINPRLDSIGFSQHFQFQNQLDNRTLFDDVKIMTPGSMVEIDENLRIRTETYWTYFEDQFDSRIISKREIEQEITMSVRDNLIGDVLVGSFLSGGIDSTLIATLASSELFDLNTFTIGFETGRVSEEELTYDESQTASSVAQFLGIPNKSRKIKAGEYLERWAHTVYSVEDLRVGPSVQNDFASELASKDVKVVLSGTGGDELFGGYPWRYPDQNLTTEHAFKFWYDKFNRVIKTAELPIFMSKAALRKSKEWDGERYVKDIWNSTPSISNIDRALRMDLRYFLHGLLLIEDRLSMKHGLEVRVPFLHERLVELSLAIQPNQKIDGSLGKLPLRSCFEKALPSEIGKAKKQGFIPPLATWIARDYRKLIESKILMGSKFLPEYFDMKVLRRTYEEHCRLLNHKSLFWSIISFEIWNRIFIGGESPQEISFEFLSSAI